MALPSPADFRLFPVAGQTILRTVDLLHPQIPSPSLFIRVQIGIVGLVAEPVGVDGPVRLGEDLVDAPQVAVLCATPVAALAVEVVVRAQSLHAAVVAHHMIAAELQGPEGLATPPDAIQPVQHRGG